MYNRADSDTLLEFGMLRARWSARCAVAADVHTHNGVDFLQLPRRMVAQFSEVAYSEMRLLTSNLNTRSFCISCTAFYDH